MPGNELRYWEALKRITNYQSITHLRLHSERDWGLPYQEALEMAYENVLEEARQAVGRRKMPRVKIDKDGAMKVQREAERKEVEGKVEGKGG